jgi:hypothetical protein
MPSEQRLQIRLEGGRSLHRQQPLLSALDHVSAEGGYVEVESVIQHVVVKEGHGVWLNEDCALVQTPVWTRSALV